MNLTIGMATYKDFDALYFTVQHLRAFHLQPGDEIVVIDNYGCDITRDFCKTTKFVRYIRDTEVQGTAAPRARIFAEASHDYVVCVDSHVLFMPGSIEAVRNYYRANPMSNDLLQGPIVWDEMEAGTYSSHFTWDWGDQMFGSWGKDERATDPEGPAFEIPNMGLGSFSCRKEAWPGFNSNFRGFGGEEGYLHEKFRQRGGKAICLPGYRWMHKFGRPNGVPYQLTLNDKYRNHLIGWEELGLDLTSIVRHFAPALPNDAAVYYPFEALQLSGRADQYDRMELERIGGLRDQQFPISSLFEKESQAPKVVCYMVLNDRESFTEKALQDSVAAFLKQDHKNAVLVIVNNVPDLEIRTYAARTRVIIPGSRLRTIESVGRLVLSVAHADFYATWPITVSTEPTRLSTLIDEIGEADIVEDAVDGIEDSGEFYGMVTQKSFHEMVKPITSALLQDDLTSTINVVASEHRTLVPLPESESSRPSAAIWVLEPKG